MAMLQNAVLLFGRLNECLLCLTPWILLPPRDADGQTSWLATLFLSSSYAVIEPIATWALQVSAIPPWTFTLCLSPSGVLAALVSIALHENVLAEHATTMGHKFSNPGASPHQDRPWLRSTMTLLPSVTSSAFMNASLLLFGQSLYASWIQQRLYITNILGPFALFLNLACRYPDYEIYKRTGRALAPRQPHGSSVFAKAFSCLCLLVVVRLGVRTLIGIDPLLAFHPLRYDQANSIYPEPA